MLSIWFVPSACRSTKPIVKCPLWWNKRFPCQTIVILKVFLCCICPYINIYIDYEVEIENYYSYYNEDGDISSAEENIVKVLDGGKLIDLIAGYFASSDFSDFYISSIDSFMISMFCPFDGTGQDIFFKIKKEIKND